MKSAWFIAVREVRERTRLFLFAAALAVMPFATTLLPGTRGHAADTIELMARVLATALGGGLAIVFGMSISRDLAERRMSFWFTKPVSATSIWIGKSTAALFVALAASLVIAVPSILATRSKWRDLNLQLLGEVLVFLVALYLVSHTASTMIRSRSPLLALDFLFLAVSVGAAWIIVRPLFLAILWGVPLMVFAIPAGVLIVLAIAPVWQLANGRSDIRRSHVALMRFLWPGVAIVLLIAGGAVAWLVNASPEDLSVQYLDQAPRGSLVMISGPARSSEYVVSFLLDRASGQVTRIGAPLWWGAQFSEDGRVAAWAEPSGLFRARVMELHTSRGGTGIEMPLAGDFVLSSDGSRVAVTNGMLLTVYDVATGNLLASGAGLDGSSRHQLFFVTPDVVRVIEHQPRVDVATPLRVFELDVRARKTLKLGEESFIVSRQNAVSVSGDGSRMLVHEANVIVDGQTARTIAVIGVPDVYQSAMLYDGRVAVVTRAPQPHLYLFDRDGKPLRDLAFPGFRAVWVSAETEDGKLLLAANDRRTVVVDLPTGTIERTISVRGPDPWRVQALPRFAANQELVALDRNGKLVVWKNEGRTAVRPLFSSR